MKSKIFYALTFLALTPSVYSQVGIGTKTPNKSAQLEVSATDKGVLIPRIALTSETQQIGSVPNAESLLVFHTGSAGMSKGYYYWDAEATTSVAGQKGAWVPLLKGDDFSPAIDGIILDGEVTGKLKETKVAKLIGKGVSDIAPKADEVLTYDTAGEKWVAKKVGIDNIDGNTGTPGQALTIGQDGAVKWGNVSAESVAGKNLTLDKGLVATNVDDLKGALLKEVTLSVKVDEAKGVEVGANGVAVKADGAKGVEVGANGVAVKADGTKGVEVGANGVAVKVEANKGLEVGANGVAVKTGSGITVGADGVSFGGDLTKDTEIKTKADAALVVKSATDDGTANIKFEKLPEATPNPANSNNYEFVSVGADGKLGKKAIVAGKVYGINEETETGDTWNVTTATPPGSGAVESKPIFQKTVEVTFTDDDAEASLPAGAVPADATVVGVVLRNTKNGKTEIYNSVQIENSKISVGMGNSYYILKGKFYATIQYYK